MLHTICTNLHLPLGIVWIGAEASWISNLERSLKDSQRESIRRIRREPEPEVLVRTLGLLDDLLQGLEPLGEQVAVLQQDPEASGGPCFEHSCSDGALPLAEGDIFELGRSHPVGLGKLKDAVRRVGPRR